MAGEKLSQDKLQTAESVLTLGLIVVRELLQKGVVSVFLNSDGVAELLPPGELELDGLPQDDALAILLDRGYEDEQLMAYVVGRMAREASRNG